MNGEDYFFIFLVRIGENIGKVVFQTNTRTIVHFLQSPFSSTVVGITTPHLLATPQVYFTFQHFCSSQRPVMFSVFVGIVTIKCRLRRSNVFFDTGHHFRCRRSSLLYICQINGRTTGVSQMQNDIPP